MLLAVGSRSATAACVNSSGGYPWPPNACLTSIDLNAAISGRLPVSTSVTNGALAVWPAGGTHLLDGSANAGSILSLSIGPHGGALNEDGSFNLQVLSGAGHNLVLGAQGGGQTILATEPTIVSGYVGSSDRANVKAFGAKGDGVTDDTAKIQDAVNSLGFGGLVLVPPPGVYCIKTGPVNVSVANVTISGLANLGGAQFSACGADVGVLVLNGFGDTVRDLFVGGSTTVTTTHDTIVMGASCSQCTLINDGVNQGRHNLSSSSGEIHIRDSQFAYAYGSSLIYFTNGGGYIIHSAVDQNPPGCTPAAASLTPPAAWQAATAYAVCNIVSTAGFYLQATAVTGDAKSGGSAPTVRPYLNDIADNHVTWRLFAPTTFYGVQADTGAQQLYITDTDISGVPFTASLALTNTLSGAAPGRIYAEHVTLSAMAEDVLASGGGSVLNIANSEMNYCALTNCAGVYADATWAGQLQLSNNQINTDAYGVRVLAGAGNVVDPSNIFSSNTVAATSMTAGTTALSSFLGAVSVGNTTLPADPLSGGAIVSIGNANASATRIAEFAFGASSALDLFRANGTAASPTAITSGQNIGFINFLGLTTGTTFALGAVLVCAAGEDWSSGHQGTNCTIQTTPVGSSTAANVLRVLASGGVAVGTAADPGINNFAAAGYYSGNTPGVDCSANTVTLATLVVTKGIVTHC